jgi:hypothetical protein
MPRDGKVDRIDLSAYRPRQRHSFPRLVSPARSLVPRRGTSRKQTVSISFSSVFPCAALTRLAANGGSSALTTYLRRF